MLPSLLVVAWSCWILARCGNAQRGIWLDAVDGRALWVLAETQVVAETQEWVSDDAEPWRTECKGSNKRFSKQFNSWRRCRFNKHKPNSSCVKHVRQQRRRRRPRQRQGKESEQAKAVSQGGASGGGPSGFGIDTRMLGRPDTFDGSESKRGDWSTVMKAYAALCNASLVSAMPASEVEAQEKRNSDLRDQLDVEASVALYFMLVLLTRNEPLNIVVNSGAGEGLLAWRRLVQRYDSAAATRLACLLLNLMNWSFAGDIQSRMELFDREMQRYETRARESVSLNLRVGMVLNGLDRGPLKDHLLLNSAKYLTWQEFKSEIVNYRRATQAIADSGGVASMDVGAFTKGDKGRGRGVGKGTQDQTCHNCGGRGHFKKDCKKPGGEAYWPDSRAKAKPKSKGKGKGWKGQNRDKKTVNAVEDDDEEEYHDEEEQEQPENEEGLGAMFVCALSKQRVGSNGETVIDIGRRWPEFRTQGAGGQ